MKIPTRAELVEKIFTVRRKVDFEQLCITIFHYQLQNNEIYAAWLKALNYDTSEVTTMDKIPFLPISFFKTHKVVSAEAPFDVVFSSSGTSGTTTSNHYVKDVSIYERSFHEGFERIYGNVEDLVIIGLLPSYLERNGSSLIYMCEELIKKSKQVESGFYLYEFEQLKNVLSILKNKNKKTVLFGVSYALLDFSEIQPAYWDNLVVIETGGMKGKRKEMIREELHSEIRNSWPINNLNSEYGMTELLSQAYLRDGSLFSCPDWMEVKVRDVSDPFQLIGEDKTGGLNVIDLANLDSCSFIATQDLGRVFNDGKFEVLGRFDHSDSRGCNLLL